MVPDILVTGTLPDEAQRVIVGGTFHDASTEPEAVPSCEVLMAWPSRVTAELLKSAGSLKMIQSFSAGVDALPTGAVPRGVLVCSNAGAYTGPVAEHAWGMLLGLSKGLHERNRRTTPRRLAGKTLLIVGAGAIGSEVARLSGSLKMKTVGVSRSFKHSGDFSEMVSPEDLKKVVGEADAIVMALPLNRETRGMVGYDVLSMCKPDVMVVNVGRGETVVEEGLTKWLKERPESRYATDVFWKKGGKEVFDTKGWDHQNFAGTLHVSGVPLGDTLAVPYRMAAENVKKFLDTGAPMNVVDLAEYGS